MNKVNDLFSLERGVSFSWFSRESRMEAPSFDGCRMWLTETVSFVRLTSFLQSMISAVRDDRYPNLADG
jgi:hypothetical protein